MPVLMGSANGLLLAPLRETFPRKLSLRQTLRHRLPAMTYLRFQDDDDSLAGTVTSVMLGAVAGFAVGMLVAQRVGGFSGLAKKVRLRGSSRGGSMRPSGPAVADDFSEFDEDYDDELEDEGVPNEGLEERVLEAFRNDPILSERAIDIGGIGDETIELAGWVNTEEEAEHAVVLARGVPGVETVVNRIAVGDVEERIARPFAAPRRGRRRAHRGALGRSHGGHGTPSSGHVRRARPARRSAHDPRGAVDVQERGARAGRRRHRGSRRAPRLDEEGAPRATGPAARRFRRRACRRAITSPIRLADA